ncbi:MAG: NUDIX domain-containing protein [Gemmatimonadetes bacterium]|nr:NUDIX domain-containing protein [Gemmatimonadota bacterium]MBT6150128.1 NUDIX domain-containing protein [Gemmatimonadota bacterium]MBT7860259.1 NUDIX domain-containing protein [Gemmatimonadota bacterium]
MNRSPAQPEPTTEPPYGAAVIVYRRVAPACEYLVLHRAHSGPEEEGDWAWTPPSGGRHAGEPVHLCAARELEEETGLKLDLQRTKLGNVEWSVFRAEADVDAAVVLDPEHDRHLWLPATKAAARCQPELVGQRFIQADDCLRETQP